MTLAKDEPRLLPRRARFVLSSLLTAVFPYVGEYVA